MHETDNPSSQPIVVPKPRRTKASGLPIIHPFAAGIDIGSRFHVAAVSPELTDQSVQTFQAFTGDVVRMADWLLSVGVKTVVMESTGVYWVAAFEVLESRGLEVVLANAREARALPMVITRYRSHRICWNRSSIKPVSPIKSGSLTSPTCPPMKVGCDPLVASLLPRRGDQRFV